MGLSTPPGGHPQASPHEENGPGAEADATSGGDDLSREAISQQMPDRPLRTYPALLSTEAEAMAWGRKGAPGGALVVAAYQASPRGRSGLERVGLVSLGEGLGFSLVLRLGLDPQRQGWPYAATTCAIAGVLAGQSPQADVGIEWPDEVHVDDELTAAVGVHAEGGSSRIRWMVVTALIAGVQPPRAAQLRGFVEAIEAAHDKPSEEVLEAYRARSLTLGRRVNARLLPLGSTGPQVIGEAVDVLADGALAIDSEDHDRRVAVPPQDLGHLEDPDDPGPQQPPETTR